MMRQKPKTQHRPTPVKQTTCNQRSAVCAAWHRQFANRSAAITSFQDEPYSNPTCPEFRSCAVFLAPVVSKQTDVTPKIRHKAMFINDLRARNLQTKFGKNAIFCRPSLEPVETPM
jgi:hypothetical protein